MTDVLRPRAFTIAGFCLAHGVGRTKVFEEIRKGRLRAVKAGGATLITSEDAAAWLASLPAVNGHHPQKLNDPGAQRTGAEGTSKIAVASDLYNGSCGPATALPSKESNHAYRRSPRH